MPSEAGKWPVGYDRVVLDTVDSTMAEAQRRMPDLAGPTWIMARQQAAGRGRRGRPWVMPLGNFAGTLVLPRPGTPMEAAQRSFVAALALNDALCGYVEPARVALKWPNDVLVDGRKIAGILLESQGAGPDHLAIGIGVNLADAPPMEILEQGAVPPIALADLSAPPAPEAFLTALAAAYADAEQQFQHGGFTRTRTAWLARAAKLGEVIIARTTREAITGTFVDVDKDGQLVLETPEGRVALPAADIYF